MTSIKSGYQRWMGNNELLQPRSRRQQLVRRAKQSKHGFDNKQL